MFSFHEPGSGLLRPALYVTEHDGGSYTLSLTADVAFLTGPSGFESCRLHVKDHGLSARKWAAGAKRWAETKILGPGEMIAIGTKGSIKPAKDNPVPKSNVALRRLRLRLAALRQLLLAGRDDRLARFGSDPAEVGRVARLLYDADVEITGHSGRRVQYLRAAQRILGAEPVSLPLSDDGYTHLMIDITEPEVIGLR